MSLPLVECRGAVKRFGGMVAVDGVSFGLMPGEIISILGASGCGKTTLLRLIAGFELLDGGEIAIRSEAVSSAWAHLPPERRNIGMVFQEYALFPHMTVGQNIGFGLRGIAGDERRRRVGEALDLVDLAALEGRYPHELSGGQQQRVALARTLAPQPIAMLLDEPFSNLDAEMRHSLRREVAGILRGSGISAIFVTHDREEAFAVADRVGVMRAGRLEQLDAPAELYRAPASPEIARLVGDCDFLTGVARGDGVETAIGRLEYTLGGGESAGRVGDDVKLAVMVRPHDLRVEADAAGGCRVRSVEFRGGETMVFVDTPLGDTARCLQRGGFGLAVGDAVRLTPVDGGAFLAFPIAGDGDF